MSPAPHVSPRIRAYGKARIDITRRARDEDEWHRLWKDPAQPYLFTPGEGWKFNIVYTVEDYAAEIGFFIDVLGFPVLAFSPSQVQLTSPDGGFTFTILATGGDEPSTPPEALRLQIHVATIVQVVRELERRGITLDQQPTPVQAGSAWQIASFRTPHGLTIQLMSEVLVDNTSPEPGQDIERGSITKSLNDDQTETDDAAAINKMSERADVSELSIDLSREQPDLDQASEPQPSSWPRIPGGVGKQNASRANRVQSSKPGNGNIELTYDPLDEITTEEDVSEEDFP